MSELVSPRLRDVIAAAASQLSRAGVDSPRHDAERLVAHALGLRWSDLWSAMDGPIDGDRRVHELVDRRASGEPFAYIVGSTVFYGIEIACGPGVLVPRPETETVADVALELVGGRSEPVVVDIGTGTGAIALAIASKRPDATVYATDISEEALVYARRNARAHDLSVTFCDGDLLDALPDELRGRIDLIVSNPPYVPDSAALPSDVRAEPPVALYAGPTGDELLTRLAAGARGWLRPGGALVVEIGEPRQASVIGDAHVRADLTGKPRVAWVHT